MSPPAEATKCWAGVSLWTAVGVEVDGSSGTTVSEPSAARVASWMLAPFADRTTT